MPYLSRIKKFVRENRIPLVILFLGLLLTFFSYRTAQQSLAGNQKKLFDARALSVQNMIRARMEEYLQGLKAVRGIYYILDTLRRDQFHKYVQSIGFSNDLPGMEGIGYAPLLKSGELEGFLSNIHQEGFYNYSVFPAGNRSRYAPIKFLEPLSERNLKALGFDMFSEKNRRDAMLKAIYYNDASLSRSVILKQEHKVDPQNGFLLYLPIFNTSKGTVEGFVYTPFRPRELIANFLGNRYNDLYIEIYDGTELTPNNLLFSNHDKDQESSFSSTRLFNLFRTTWIIKAFSTPAFGSEIDKRQLYWIYTTGIICSVFFFTIAYSISNTKRKALQIARDMTRALRENQEHLAAVADTAQEAIITANAEGLIVYFNKSAASIFGRSRADVLGKKIQLLMPERYRNAHEKGMERFIDTRDPKIIGRTVELHGLHPEKGEFPIELSLSGWESTQGVFFTAMIRDITERKKTENELIAKTVDLERSNKELENFAAITSHDLQEPLRTIASFLQLLELRYHEALDEKARTYIDTAIAASVRMKNLINSLLEYSTIDKARHELLPVQLNNILTEVLSNLEDIIREKQAKIEVRSVLPTLRGNHAQLLQLFQNLIGNALKFVQTLPVRIEIDCKEGENEYLFSVKDNGIGIADTYKEKIFKIFQRLHKEQFAGTGIGLALCKKIVENMDGRIWVESTPGQGSTFFFTVHKNYIM